MRKFKKVAIEKDVVEEIYCNICGEEITKNIHSHFDDYLHIEKVWGYHSKKDGKKDDFDVCQRCYEEWIKTFKISI